MKDVLIGKLMTTHKQSQERHWITMLTTNIKNRINIK